MLNISHPITTENRLMLRHVSCFAEYQSYLNDSEKIRRMRDLFMEPLRQKRESFTVPGWCFVCNNQTEFRMDIPMSSASNPNAKPPQKNWRERMNCRNCGFNNRARAAIHIFQQECNPNLNSAIYITEQTTNLFKITKENHPLTIGSEYLGNETPYGECNVKGIRNESITNLSFRDNSLDFILSFDVFEHVPNYADGFRECLRCLRPGGKLLMTVPFISSNEATTVRATVQTDGSVIHHLPPEYHGDPINSSGCLCFYHFGWDVLDSLRNVGFPIANALLYWASEYGYIGYSDQICFLAQKSE